MKSLYSKFSSIKLEEIELDIINSINLITEDIKSNMDVLVKSKNIILDLIKHPFYTDKNQLVSKYHLFSPYMMDLITRSGYSSILEEGGLGLLSEVMKENFPEMKVTFNNINENILNFSKWRFNRNGLDINNNLDLSYDIIVSDGYIQYFEEEIQNNIIKSYIDRLSKNGLLCLLIDITGENIETPLKKNVDITNIHYIIEQSDMVCIYGKNTFSSLWKKMI